MPIRAALALTAAVALLAPLGAQARTQQTRVIKVMSVSIGVPIQKDKPPKGASKGDTIVFHDNLVNAAKQFGKKVGAKVGVDQGKMTFTAKNAARFDGIAKLPGGTLTLKGAVAGAPDGKSLLIPVTGGTGKYAGAHGSLLVGPGSKRSLNVYTLTLPGALSA